jgi:hypothetical protein
LAILRAKVVLWTRGRAISERSEERAVGRIFYFLTLLFVFLAILRAKVVIWTRQARFFRAKRRKSAPLERFFIFRRFFVFLTLFYFFFDDLLRFIVIRTL